MNVGERIKKARLAAGYTQVRLGARCGMADSAIRRYESGRGNPTYETPVIRDLEQISEIFECLNNVGRQKTIDFALDLLEIPRYRKPAWKDKQASWIALRKRNLNDSNSD